MNLRRRRYCSSLELPGGMNAGGYSIFGIAADQKHALKWLFP
jgi:hypothetical protein